MNKSESIQIFVAILGAIGSWQLSQWWLIVLIALYILCIPIFKLLKSKSRKKKYRKLLTVTLKKLQDLLLDVSNKHKTLSNNMTEINKLVEICTKLNQVFSGSWLGYHSSIYYKDFQYPPTNSFFNPEWGLGDPYRPIARHGSIGNWTKYTENEIDIEISKNLGEEKNLKKILNKIEGLDRELQYSVLKTKFFSMITTLTSHINDTFLEEQYKKIKEMPFENDIIAKYAPTLRASRDSLAVHQGWKIPRHIQLLSKGLYYNNYIYHFQIFKDVIKETCDHINHQIELEGYENHPLKN